MIYFLEIIVSTIFTIALGLFYYFSDEPITIGKLIYGLFLCCMGWISVFGYVVLMIAYGIYFLTHQDFWYKSIFLHDEKYKKDENETYDIE